MKPVPPEVLADPHVQARIIDLLEWAGRAAIALATMKGFLAGIYKPFATWRKEHNAKTIREVLKPELDQLANIIHDESGCAENMKSMLDHMRVVFDDLDKFLVIATDNRDRLDETNALLDEVFHLERRVDLERRAAIDEMLLNLRDRATFRKRGLAGGDAPAPA